MNKKMVIVLLACCAFTTANAADTVLDFYRPFEKTPKIIKEVQGQCTSQSRLILREDAWSCMAGGKSMDPCFASPGLKPMSVLCLNSPWSSEGIKVLVNAPLNNEAHQSLDMSRAFPWAIELTNGERCQAIEATQVFDSMPIRYICTKDNVLMGTIQRCDPAWSMLEKTSQGVTTMNIEKVWF